MTQRLDPTPKFHGKERLRRKTLDDIIVMVREAGKPGVRAKPYLEMRRPVGVYVITDAIIRVCALAKGASLNDTYHLAALALLREVNAQNVEAGLPEFDIEMFSSPDFLSPKYRRMLEEEARAKSGTEGEVGDRRDDVRPGGARDPEGSSGEAPDQGRDRQVDRPEEQVDHPGAP